MAIVLPPPLKFQAAFTGTFSKSLNTAVVYEAAAVIDHFGDALFKALLGDALANLLGSVAVAAIASKSFSRVEAEASVTPASSSMICA